MRILIPLDGSELAEKALEAAEPLARAAAMAGLLLRAVRIASAHIPVLPVRPAPAARARSA